MLRSTGVDPKIAPLVEVMCENGECANVINGQLTEWFRTVVRQGCLLSNMFVIGVRHGRSGELMQGVQARFQPLLWHQICR